MDNKIIKKVVATTLLSTMFVYTTPIFAYTKDETVYSKLDNKGNNYNTIVDTHIKNYSKEKEINDLTDLMNIKNVNGDEEFNINENKLIWNSNGNDIYYEGESKKELPIECKIKYELNGKEIDVNDLVGKEGKVNIIVEYINKDKHNVTINGKNVELYTPFTVVCGTIIDNKNNKDIEVTNGKVVDNGNRTIVIGIAMPGMQESLGIDKEKIDIPSSVTVSFETEKFELKNLITYATPQILENINLDKFNTINDIYSMSNKLKSASNQLVDGSNKLSNGANKLNDGMNTLSSKLNNEISKYENIRKELNNKEELQNKIINLVNVEVQKLLPELEALASKEAKNVIQEHKENINEDTIKIATKYTKEAVKEKLDELSKNNYNILNKEQEEELKNLLEQDIVNTIKEIETNPKIMEMMQEIENSMKKEAKDEVKNIITNNKVDLSKVSSMPEEMQNNIISKYSQEINKIKMINPDVTDIQALQMIATISNDTLDTVNVKVANAIDNVNVKNKDIYEKKIQEYIENVSENVANKFTENSMETLNLYKLNIQNKIIENLKNKINSDELINNYINNAKKELNSNIDKIINSTAEELADKYAEELIKEITNNLIKKQLSGELKESELNKELSKYEELINSKLKELDNSVNELKQGLKQLTDGTNSLAEGANKLSNGMNKFDKEAIQKIYNLVNNNVKDIQLRIENLQKLSEEYNTFTMLDEKNNGTVKFIMVMDSIKEKENKKEEIILENKNDDEKSIISKEK